MPDFNNDNLANRASGMVSSLMEDMRIKAAHEAARDNAIFETAELLQEMRLSQVREREERLAAETKAENERKTQADTSRRQFIFTAIITVCSLIAATVAAIAAVIAIL